jgi:hypothetical protein
LFKEGGMFAPRGIDYRYITGAGLNNSIVFTWGFLEMSAWFWVCPEAKRLEDLDTDSGQVFVTLREERREKARKLIEKRQAEADRL